MLGAVAQKYPLHGHRSPCLEECAGDHRNSLRQLLEAAAVDEEYGDPALGEARGKAGGFCPSRDNGRAILRTDSSCANRLPTGLDRHHAVERPARKGKEVFDRARSKDDGLSVYDTG